MSRYQQVYKLPSGLYAENCPIIIEAGALLKDTEENKILVQLKLRNISEDTVISCKIAVRAFETNGTETEGEPSFSYLDIHVSPDGEFGTKTPVYLPDSNARKFVPFVMEIVFSNGTVWKSQNHIWKAIPEHQKLISVLPDSEIWKQYSVEVNSNCENVPEQKEGLFLCTCGAVNLLNAEKCCRCHRSYAFLRSALNIEELTKKKESRLQKEAEQREAVKIAEAKRLAEEEQHREEEIKRRAEERIRSQEEAERKKKKIMKKIFIPVSVILILFIALKISFPYYIYHLGMKNYEQGDMYQAFIQFRYMVRHRPKNEKYKEMMEKAGNLYIQEQYDQWADYNLSRYGTVDDSWANLDEFQSWFELQMEGAEEADIDFYETIYGFAVQAYDNKEYLKAAATFMALGDYKDSADYLEKKELLFIIKGEGDIITFGKYDWYIINKSREGTSRANIYDTMILLCKDVVGTKSYHEELTDVTWENCTLRAWLNDSFYNEFSEDEKTMMLKTTCSDDEKNITEDYIYLLNEYEVYQIPEDFKNDILLCQQNWWLRSHGEEEQTADFINIDYIEEGTPYWYGTVTQEKGVRPAVKIRVD